MLDRLDGVSVVDAVDGWSRIRSSAGEGWVQTGLLMSASARDAIERAERAATLRAIQAAAASERAGVPVAVDAPSKSPREVLAADPPPVVEIELGVESTQEAPVVARAPADTDDGAERTGAASAKEQVEISGIPFVWGMSRPEAIRLYTSKAVRIDDTGAIWLRAKALGANDQMPIEWLDLTYCDDKLCRVRQVFNNPEAKRADFVDSIVANVAKRYGKPAQDRWFEDRYGRQRVRVWQSPTSRITVSHQEQPYYVNVDYESVNAFEVPSAMRDATSSTAAY